jgi:uncharacterized protein (DUF111 family)
MASNWYADRRREEREDSLLNDVAPFRLLIVPLPSLLLAVPLSFLCLLGSMAASPPPRQEDEASPWTSTRNPRQPRHAHLDCLSGIAGDMLLAACLDVGGASLCDHVDTCLRRGLPALDGEFQIRRQRPVWRGPGQLAATYVKVESLYGHAAAPLPLRKDVTAVATPMVESSHDHSHGHGHSHGHSHGHAHAVHGEPDVSPHHDYPAVPHTSKQAPPPTGPLRNLPQIRQMLTEAPDEWISPWVRRVALAAFERLAQAEAHVHGAACSDAVHFHEVGAVDSIVDTVGSLLALEALGVTTVTCSRLPLGEGTVRAAHGLLPVPAPATLRLLEGLPVMAGPPGITGELVTPTGAALVQALLAECGLPGAPHDGRPPRFTLRHTGLGAGTKDFTQHANILRLLLGDDLVVAAGRASAATS